MDIVTRKKNENPDEKPENPEDKPDNPEDQPDNPDGFGDDDEFLGGGSESDSRVFDPSVEMYPQPYWCRFHKSFYVCNYVAVDITSV
jgi:hypothetical protein